MFLRSSLQRSKARVAAAAGQMRLILSVGGAQSKKATGKLSLKHLSRKLSCLLRHTATKKGIEAPLTFRIIISNNELCDTHNYT